MCPCSHSRGSPESQRTAKSRAGVCRSVMTQQPCGTRTVTTSFVNSDGASDAQAAVAAALVNG